ncbi:MAG: aspartyl/asparaginyl beta-hydroxylase domain-containing protein [Bacteroidetes bacterium]|nr:MAG: aspartyl/asparaginyl beta-hydroxylase domain-containing protein [Bacteroidota bacterium]
MIILKILGIAILVFVVLLVLAYFIQPALLTLPYTTFIKLFVKNPPFVPVEEHFPQHKLLKDNWEVIRDELLEVLKDADNIPKFHEVDSIQRFISAKDDVPWRTFIIKAYDKWQENNAAKVPKTTELLKQTPQITTAMFSILDGGKHIPPHMGFFKAVLRYHLGLIVPTDAPCYIVVGGEKYSWKEGEDVLFDDTYMHEVWNKSPNRRVVLFCDVYREKGLPGWVKKLNRKMFNLLATSKRLSKAVKKAEVTKDIASTKKSAA